MTPRVAVLTVTYNQERYIGQCIESVLAQTLGDWEVVIADDGSSDRTCDIAESYRDPRIKVVRLPHRGIPSMHETYAVALRASTAPLLAILDGDDYWYPHRLESQVPLFDDLGVVMAFGEVDVVDEEGAIIDHGVVPRFARGTRDGSEIVVPMLRNRFFCYSATVLVRRGAVEALGGFLQPAGVPLVDMPTWLNVLPGRRCAGIGATIAAYRVHSKSVCRTMTGSVDDGQMRYAEDFLDCQWRRIGMSAGQYRRLRRELIASHAHRRAVAMAASDWSGARALFAQALRIGSPSRKFKTAARYLVLALHRPKVTG